MPAPVMSASRSVAGLREVGAVLEQAPPTVAAAPPPVVAAPAPPMSAASVPPSAPPPSLTANIPDPAAVAAQKDQHLRNLDAQLQQGLLTIDQTFKEKREGMFAQAEKQKVDFYMKVDQEVKMQELDLDKQFLSVVQYVKQEATRQRALLQQQAMTLTFQYQERKVEEDMLAQQFELHKQQTAIQETMSRQAPIQPLTSLVQAPTNVPEQTRALVIGAPPSVASTPAPALPGVAYGVPQSSEIVRQVAQSSEIIRPGSYMPPASVNTTVVTSGSYVPEVQVAAPYMPPATASDAAPYMPPATATTVGYTSSSYSPPVNEIYTSSSYSPPISVPAPTQPAITREVLPATLPATVVRPAVVHRDAMAPATGTRTIASPAPPLAPPTSPPPVTSATYVRPAAALTTSSIITTPAPVVTTAAPIITTSTAAYTPTTSPSLLAEVVEMVEVREPVRRKLKSQVLSVAESSQGAAPPDRAAGTL